MQARTRQSRADNSGQPTARRGIRANRSTIGVYEKGQRRRREAVSAYRAHADGIQPGILREPPVDIVAKVEMTGDRVQQLADNTGNKAMDGLDLALPPQETHARLIRARGCDIEELLRFSIAGLDC